MKSLGDRMKEYERVGDIKLTRRTPVVIRIDGCHFHSFARRFDKPFDSLFRDAMKETTDRLVQSIQGCVIGYTQSDEISLVLCDYKSLDTDAWFANRVQKICSVAASKATLYFNRAFSAMITERSINESDPHKKKEILDKYVKSIVAGAEFDARCFNLPKEEVCNYLLWRQQDAERNSIQALAQSLYSQSELHGVNCVELIEKMRVEKAVDWNDESFLNKHGYYTDGRGRWNNVMLPKDWGLISDIVTNGGMCYESDH